MSGYQIISNDPDLPPPTGFPDSGCMKAILPPIINRISSQDFTQFWNHCVDVSAGRSITTPTPDYSAFLTNAFELLYGGLHQT